MFGFQQFFMAAEMVWNQRAFCHVFTLLGGTPVRLRNEGDNSTSEQEEDIENSS